MARERLISGGIQVTLIERKTINTSATHYQLGYKRLSASIPQTGAVLIQGDVMDDPPTSARSGCVDPNLESWLLSLGGFDAVACWLIGSHNARVENVALRGRYSSPGDYRLRVENYVYEFADRVLKPGGVLHIVDRGEPHSTEALKNDLFNSRKEQASPTSLIVIEELHERPCDLSKQSVKMGITIGSAGRIADVNIPHVYSILASKPAVFASLSDPSAVSNRTRPLPPAQPNPSGKF